MSTTAAIWTGLAGTLLTWAFAVLFVQVRRTHTRTRVHKRVRTQYG
jgi:hypothetical protein